VRVTSGRARATRCSALGRRPLKPGEEHAAALLTEGILDRLPERERRRIHRAQGIVEDEPIREAPAYAPAMLRVPPAGGPQLIRVALAQLAQHRCATDPRPARHHVQLIGPVGVESGQVQEAKRPASIDAHHVAVALQRVQMQVPHAEVAPGIVENRRGETCGRQLEVARQPGTILGAETGVARVERAQRLFDLPLPPGEKVLRRGAAVDRDDRLVYAARPLQLLARGFQAVVGHVHCRARDEQHAVSGERIHDRLQIAQDPGAARHVQHRRRRRAGVATQQARSEQGAEIVELIAREQPLDV